MDKGIIFSAAMVRALLDGRKTQTRRLCKPANEAALSYVVSIGDGWFGDEEGVVQFNAPYAPGDRLYVREAWRADGQLNAIKPTEMSRGEPILYEADGTLRQTGCSMIEAGNLRPSIFLPRWASRLTLLVADVRVQRVAEISEDDARAEGAMQCTIQSDGSWTHGHSEDWRFLSAKGSFQDLWNSLHTKPGETWADNPWIVAVSFTVKHGNIDRIEP